MYLFRRWTDFFVFPFTPHFLPHRIEVGVLHTLLRSEPLLHMSIILLRYVMIIDQQVVKQIVQLCAQKSRIPLRRKFRPVLLATDTDLRHHLRVHVKLVLLDVLEESFRSQHLRNASELLRIALGAEEGKAVEHDSRDHAAERPHVDRVVVVLLVSRRRWYGVVRQQLGTLVVARAHAHIQLVFFHE